MWKFGVFRIRMYFWKLWIHLWTFGRNPWTGNPRVTRPLSPQENPTQKNSDKHLWLVWRISRAYPDVETGEKLLRWLVTWEKNWMFSEIKWL